MTVHHTRATIVATTTLAGGTLASLAGNLQAIHLDNARPGIGAIVSAVFWPLAIFGVVELILHTPWVANWRDHLTKLATVVLVGAVAIWVSYWHLANVLSNYGYDVVSRYVGPVAVDMCMVLAALALNRVGQARRLTTGQEDLSVQDWPEPLATGQQDMDTPPPMMDNWTRPLDLATVQQDQDRAMTALGQEVVQEAETLLATQPVSPAPRWVRVDKGEVADMIRELWSRGKSANETDLVVAGWFNCSVRTARRERDALELTWPKRSRNTP